MVKKPKAKSSIPKTSLAKLWGTTKNTVVESTCTCLDLFPYELGALHFVVRNRTPFFYCCYVHLCV